MPKYATRSIFGAKGQQSRGYVINFSNPGAKPKKIQDSPKEDHILCTDCEKYFGQLETYVALNLENRINDPEFSKDFPEGKADKISYKVCKKLDVKLWRLHMFSIFWRCSIPSVLLFNCFKSSYEAELRDILWASYGLKIEDIKNSSNHSDLFKHTLFVVRGAPGHNQDNNNLLALPEKNGVDLITLNENLVFLSKEQNAVEQLRQFDNRENHHVRIVYLSASYWNKSNSDQRVILEHRINEINKS